ncbi:MAG: hypothetical protein ACMUIU_10425 [bacterium]
MFNRSFNLIKKALIIIVIFLIFQPKIVFGKILPEELTEKNQGAGVIVIGEVYDIGAAILIRNAPEKPMSPPLNRFLVLKVVHVVKGEDNLKPKSLIHILSVDDPEKQKKGNKKAQKDFPFQTEKGFLIIVYADPVPDNPGFYKPLFGEKSVFTIGRSLQKPNEP